MTDMYFSPPTIHLISEFSLSVLSAFISSLPASSGQSAPFKIARFQRYDLQCKQALITLFYTLKKKNLTFVCAWLALTILLSIFLSLLGFLFLSSLSFNTTFLSVVWNELKKDLGRGYYSVIGIHSTCIHLQAWTIFSNHFSLCDFLRL